MLLAGSSHDRLCVLFVGGCVAVLGTLMMLAGTRATRRRRRRAVAQPNLVAATLVAQPE